MPISDPITEASLKEMRAIFSWARDRQERTILIGGWAVYLYNPYYGSIDIDLITSSRTRQRLSTYLRKERGFMLDRRADIDDRVLCKVIDGKRIDVDFGTLVTEDRFEGRDESISMSMLDGRTNIKEIESAEVVIPEISLLLIFKCKAAWDRSTRLANGSLRDPLWERSKFIKDLSDIIALIDTNETMDIGYLGRFFEQYSFLGSTFSQITDNPECIEKYGSDRVHVNTIIERFRSLIM